MAFPTDVRDITIPDKVDLREFLWPVENVGDIYAAAASAAVTVLEYHCYRMGEKATNLSTMFVHYNARKLAGDVAANKGSSIANVMKAITTSGACLETTWPFDEKAFATEPTPQAYEEAKKFAVVDPYATPDPITALALKFPVAFFAQFPLRALGVAGDTGAMPVITPEDAKKGTNPRHSMVLVGYDKTRNVFIARNCWGDAWGDKGYCTITVDTLNTICPQGDNHFWVINVAKPSDTVSTPPQPGVTAAETPAAPAAPTTPGAPAAGSMAANAAKMREEIRARLEKDLAASSKRIEEMMRKATGGAQPEPGVKNSCGRCYGSGTCGGCGGRGCAVCSNSGRCQTCGGAGRY